VDPGVGTERRSVVARTKDGRLFVTPDNGTLTLVDELFGIDAVREIDARLRVPESERSATFHGRDVYSLTGALLAAGRVGFEDVGPEVPVASLVRISHARATLERADGRACLVGTIPVLDPAFGNVWTDIPRALVDGHVALGASLSVTILHEGVEVFHGVMPYASTFGDVPEGAPLAYLNSLGDLAFALNRGSFAAAHGIEAGRDWSVRVGIDATR
jgi:S-adenosylmethionine hydrolase